MFEPSPYQKAFYDFIENEKGSCILDAVAGSGKTTTILESLKHIPDFRKTMLVAFNTHIVKELKSRSPHNIDVRTVNSHAWRGWLRAKSKPTIDKDKYQWIMNDLDIDDQIRRRFFSGVKKIVGLCKGLGVGPTDMAGVIPVIPDDDHVFDTIIERHDIKFKDEFGHDSDTPIDRLTATRIARAFLRHNIEETSVFDFEDQKYMSVLYGVPFEKHNFIFVDEAQDLSPVERVLLRRSLKPSGRLIAVGDEKQAIYGFRGADADSMKRIGAEFDCAVLPLSISYRCPKAVIREAQRFVPRLEAAPNAIEGIVKDVGSYHHTMFKAKDLVLCRCKAPLFKLAYYLISQKVPVTVIGRDIGGDLINKINSFNPYNIKDLVKKTNEWAGKAIEKKLKKDPDADLSYYEDVRDAINIFAEYSEAKTIDELIFSVESLFKHRHNAVELATVHKAKGLEADTVYILNKFLMPLSYAKQDWQKQQEDNIHYVAITRAKKELFYIKTPEQH